MHHQNRRTISRRTALKTIGTSSLIGMAGCLGGESESTGNGSDGGSTGATSDNIDEWGERLNDHAREADIDWEQFEGTSLVLGMNVHPFTELMEQFLPHFEELTGISVQFNTFPEDQLWQRLTLDLESETGQFDGFMLGLWPGSQYHSADWVHDMSGFYEDSSLTDQDWFAMDDFPTGVMDSYRLGQDDELIGIPFGVEGYGAVGYDAPTFEELGLEPPTDYPSMRDAAQTIHESDETDRLGICSRASSTTLSSANWATVFKSYGADWIDYDAREATLDSQEGIESLEIFADMMGNYGPSDIGSFDWYRSNQAFGNGEVGMVLHTPSAIGPWTDEQLERTEWVPPVPGPNGDEIAAPWTWGLGVSEYSRNPEAAWLFVQWSISREANLLQSTPVWDGHSPYGWAREGYIFDTPEWEEHGLQDSWVEAHQQALDMIPSDPPAVPLDVPQNMDIMSEAAIAMNFAVTGEKSAEEALADAAPSITEHAQDIPDAYL